MPKVNIFFAALILLLAVASLAGNAYLILQSNETNSQHEAEIRLLQAKLQSQSEAKDEIYLLGEAQADVNDNLVKEQLELQTEIKDFLTEIDNTLRVFNGQIQLLQTLDANNFSVQRNQLEAKTELLDETLGQNATKKEEFSSQTNIIYKNLDETKPQRASPN